MRRFLLWSVPTLVSGVLVALVFRRALGLYLIALFFTPPELSAPVDEGERVRWYDDYYTVEQIDADTFAIGEPRYYQQTYSYLILGEQTAVLFDSGPGLRNPRPVVESLTDLPVIAAPSHLHYDHVGSVSRFERLALVDLPWLRRRAEAAGGERLKPTLGEHLGFIEGIARPELRVTDWWAPGADVDLGARTLRVVHTPGHTPESISLWDAERKLLFTGDYITEGPLIAFAPGSSLGDYVATAESLGGWLPESARLLTGHRETPPGAPILATRDLADLRSTLLRMRAGTAVAEGVYPRIYRVNENLRLWSEPAWMAAWD